MGITTIKNCPCCKDKRCVCEDGCGYTVWSKSSWDPTGTWNKTTLAQVCQSCMSCMPEQNIIDQEGCNYPPTDEFGKCCGDCTWERVGISNRSWTKVSTDCKEDCKCPEGPQGYNCDGYKEEDITDSQGRDGKKCYKHCVRPDPCCEIKPDDPRAVDVSDKVLTCLDSNCTDYCQYYDVEYKAICCGDCSSSTSSTDSTSSESSKSTSSKSTSSTSSKSTSSSSSKSTSSESTSSESSKSTSSVSSVSSVSTSSASTSSVSSVSTSSVSASESSSSSGDLCTCGYCIWFKTIGASNWTKGHPAGGQSDFCTSGCACDDDPPSGFGAMTRCDGYKMEPYGIDTYICYKCCTASSSSQSSASSASSVCSCGCPVMCETDITGTMINFGGSECSGQDDSPNFDLEYRLGLPPALPAGAVLGDWWRGSVTHCGGTWQFVVYCRDGENGCDQLYAVVEAKPGCITITNGHESESPVDSSGTTCSCSPLSIPLGSFAGTSSGASGCCCAGCSPTSCDFIFTLQITE